MSVANVSPSPGIIHLNQPNGSLKSLEILFGGGDASFCGNSCGVSFRRTFLD